MSSLSSSLFSFKGQCVESCSIEEMSQGVFVRCRRDRRYKVKEPISGTSCTVDHYVKRRLQD
ncbi:ISL3 family transposase, partial [Vibrio pectenicida]|nr:ISL3 family transposase [Vibrio pectenicida]